MNRFNLPVDKVFWYGISISMVITSTGICFSLIRGSEFNVEALNTKLKLSGVTSKNKELTKELRQVSSELKQQSLPASKRRKLESIEKELEQTEEQIERIEKDIVEEITEYDEPGIDQTN